MLQVSPLRSLLHHSLPATDFTAVLSFPSGIWLFLYVQRVLAYPIRSLSCLLMPFFLFIWRMCILCVIRLS